MTREAVRSKARSAMIARNYIGGTSVAMTDAHLSANLSCHGAQGRRHIFPTITRRRPQRAHILHRRRPLGVRLGRSRRRKSVPSMWAELIYQLRIRPGAHRLVEVNVPRHHAQRFCRPGDLQRWTKRKCPTSSSSVNAPTSPTCSNSTRTIEQACGNRASLGAIYCGAVDRRSSPPPAAL